MKVAREEVSGIIWVGKDGGLNKKNISFQQRWKEADPFDGDSGDGLTGLVWNQLWQV